MKCNNCGNTIAEGVTICPLCGMPVGNSQTPVAQPSQPTEPVAQAATTTPVVNNTPVAPAEPIGQTPVANTPVEPTPAVPGGMTPNAPKNNNKIFIIICAVLAIIIVVLLVLVFNNGSKKNDDSNNDKPTEKTSEKTTESTTSSTTTSTSAAVVPTNGTFVDYSGIQLFVPNGFTAQESSGGVVYQSRSKNQFLAVQLTGVDYSAMTLADFSEGLTSGGYVETSRDTGNHKGVQYGVVRGTNSGVPMSTGYAAFTSGVISIFAFRTDLAKETDYLDTLVEITTNSKFPASFSKNDSKEIDYKAFITASSKLKSE